MNDFPQDLNYHVNISEQPPQRPPAAYDPPKLPDEYNQKERDQQNATQGNGNFDLNRAAHPHACIATFAFKAAAFVFYLLIGQFLSDILTFIFVIIFSAMDFWVVKNVTGRLLVGLRWWSQTDANGKEVWRFQNPKQTRNTNAVDTAFFWASQIAGTVLWGLFLILKIFSLSVFWCLLLMVCASLCGTNLYAYYQCRGDHQKKMENLKNKGIGQVIKRIL